ncbi:MAG: glucokinase [Gammaproteobacteria bacterium]|nr:glucokinase [Gammaproteobacteria bacterium]
MLVLAGDIGGTKSWLAAFDTQQSNSIVAEKIYSSQQFDSLSAVVHEFCRDFQLNTFRSACFGLPGPVTGEQAQLTNLPWLVTSQEIIQQCDIAKVKLINDFQAAALGIDAISTEQLVCLQEGSFNPQGNRLVVGAGTGLGVAPVVNTPQGFVPQPCEGGHMDFAPANELQQRLQRWLWQNWRHLSYERLLSGAGLQALYAFFSKLSLKQQEAWPQPEQIQEWAQTGQAEAIKAINAFIQIYAAYIGNLALLWPSYAGIYIAGGIGAKLEPWMRKQGFLTKLQDKGRMSDLVAGMPVYLVKDPALGLKGAMMCAKTL